MSPPPPARPPDDGIPPLGDVPADETDHQLAARIATETGVLLIDLRAQMLDRGTTSWELEAAGWPTSSSSSDWRRSGPTTTCCPRRAATTARDSTPPGCGSSIRWTAPTS